MSAKAESWTRKSILGPRYRDNVAMQVHWELCGRRGIDTDKWYYHKILPVVENREVRITWDTTKTDRQLKHNGPRIQK